LKRHAPDTNLESLIKWLNDQVKDGKLGGHLEVAQELDGRVKITIDSATITNPPQLIDEGEEI